MSSTYPIRVYAYCVDTHWHAAHYSPPTFDRPRSKRGDSSETSQRWRRSRQKKICSWATQNTNTILPQQTNLKHVGVNDVMTEYYEISHSSIQSEEVLYPTHWDIPAIRRAFELFIDFNRCFLSMTYIMHQSLMVYKYKSTILQYRSYFHSCVQRVPSHIHFVAVSIRYT